MRAFAAQQQQQRAYREDTWNGRPPTWSRCPWDMSTVCWNTARWGHRPMSNTTCGEAGKQARCGWGHVVWQGHSPHAAPLVVRRYPWHPWHSALCERRIRALHQDQCWKHAFRRGCWPRRLDTMTTTPRERPSLTLQRGTMMAVSYVHARGSASAGENKVRSTQGSQGGLTVSLAPSQLLLWPCDLPALRLKPPPTRTLRCSA